MAQESPQQCEDASEVVTDGGEDGVGGIASAAFAIAAAELALGFHVADHGLDAGSTSQFALDYAEDASLLSRDEDPVSAVSLVDIGALDVAAGELLGVLDDVPQGATVIRVAGSALACGTNWPPGARALVVTIEALTPNSLPMHSVSGHGKNTASGRAGAVAGNDLAGASKRSFERCRDGLLATDFAADVADQPAEPG